MLLRHLITLMINVRSATSRTRPKKKDLPLDFSKDMFCLPSISDAHGCGPWLVRGTRCPLAEYAASLRFQTSALPPKEGRRIPLTFRIPKKWWSLSGSNRRPEACKATALPAELRPRFGLASSAGESVRFLGCPRHGARRPVGLRKKAGRRLRRT